MSMTLPGPGCACGSPGPCRSGTTRTTPRPPTRCWRSPDATVIEASSSRRSGASPPSATRRRMSRWSDSGSWRTWRRNRVRGSTWPMPDARRATQRRSLAATHGRCSMPRPTSPLAMASASTSGGPNTSAPRSGSCSVSGTSRMQPRDEPSGSPRRTPTIGSPSGPGSRSHPSPPREATGRPSSTPSTGSRSMRPTSRAHRMAG